MDTEYAYKPVLIHKRTVGLLESRECVVLTGFVLWLSATSLMTKGCYALAVLAGAASCACLLMSFDARGIGTELR